MTHDRAASSSRRSSSSASASSLLATSGASFYSSRRLPEPVVLGPGVTAVKQLADYFEPLRGTANDCNVYVLEGKEPGATMLVLGGSHPEEPAGRLDAWVLAENAVVETGRLIVVLSTNRSATTVTRARRRLSARLRDPDRRGARAPSGWATAGPTRSTSGPTPRSTSTTRAGSNWRTWTSAT